ncbi:hypothetical protein Tco_0224661, partial [Tanacetum coccineum]
MNRDQRALGAVCQPPEPNHLRGSSRHRNKRTPCGGNKPDAPLPNETNTLPDEMMMAMRGGGVGASVIGSRGAFLEFAGKSPPENFSGGGAVAAGGGGGLPDNGEGEERL